MLKGAVAVFFGAPWDIMNNIRLFAPKPRRALNVNTLCNSITGSGTGTGKSIEAADSFKADIDMNRPGLLVDSWWEGLSSGRTSKSVSQLVEGAYCFNISPLRSGKGNSGEGSGFVSVIAHRAFSL